MKTVTVELLWRPKYIGVGSGAWWGAEENGWGEVAIMVPQLWLRVPWRGNGGQR